MKYHIIEHFSGEDVGVAAVTDTEDKAKTWIGLQFSDNPGLDYKTSFTVVPAADGDGICVKHRSPMCAVVGRADPVIDPDKTWDKIEYCPECMTEEN